MDELRTTVAENITWWHKQLHNGIDSGGVSEFVAIQDGVVYAMFGLAPHSSSLASLNIQGANIFMGVTIKKGSVFRTTKKRATKEDTLNVPALWVDIDNSTIPPSFPMPPTVLVASGHGFHAYWKLREPAPPNGATEGILRGLAGICGGDVKCAELNRLMRIPGTKNYKPNKKPVDCYIVYENFGDPIYVYDIRDFNWLDKGPELAKPVIYEPNDNPRLYASDVAALLHARRTGNMWQAICPAHDDHAPSLRIGEGEDGTVLLYCHAGCTFNEIVDALGIKMSSLFANSSRKPTSIELRRMANGGD